MTESELLIKIRTALESGGLDAAKSKLLELTEATKKTTGATAAKTAEDSKGIREIRQFTAAGHAMRAMLQGNLPAIQQTMTAMHALHGAVVKVGGAITAFNVGWQIGTQLDELLKISQSWADALSPIDKTVRSLRGEIKGLLKDLDTTAKRRDESLTNEQKAIRERVASEEASLAVEEKATREKANAEKEVALAKTRVEEKDPIKRARREADIEKKASEESLQTDKHFATRRLTLYQEAEKDAERQREEVGKRALEKEQIAEEVRRRGEKTKTRQEMQAYIAARKEAAQAVADAEKQGPLLAGMQEEFSRKQAAERAQISAGETRAVMPGLAHQAAQYDILLKEQDRKRQQEVVRLEEEKRAKEKAFEPRQKAAQEAVETANAEARLALHRAESFTPDPRLRGTKGAQQRTRDENLEQMAAAAQTQVLALKAALKQMDASHKQIIESINNQIAKMKERDKNLPID